MKKIFLLGAAFLLSMNASFASCKCSPTFTESDVSSALESFMASKVGVDAGSIRDVSLTANLRYATYNMFTDPTMVVHHNPRNGMLNDMQLSGLTRCEVDCLNSKNSVKKFAVEFVKADKVCTMGLKVTMTSKRHGFKSKVKQSYAPVCE
jgi:hypothetical protein